MLRTLHVGLGTIGREILKATVESGIGRPVAGVDPLFVGRQMSDLPEGPATPVPVHADLASALESKPDIAILSTASRVEAIASDLRTLVAAGVNCVSTCEKLAYPWLDTPQLAEELNEKAKNAGVTIVGTGVNPGFLLDALPVFLTRPCEAVSRVAASRFVNTARRRRQLQEKTGAGMTLEEFARKAEAGTVGHVGLAESAALLATGLGWEVSRADINETIEPVLAEEAVSSDYLTVPAGRVKGQLQTITLQGPDAKAIQITLKMALGLEEEYDEVRVEGVPPLHVRVIGGLFGDSATAGCTVNILRQTVAARPGLLTVLDLPLA